MQLAANIAIIAFVSACGLTSKAPTATSIRHELRGRVVVDRGTPASDAVVVLSKATGAGDEVAVLHTNASGEFATSIGGEVAITVTTQDQSVFVPRVSGEIVIRLARDCGEVDGKIETPTPLPNGTIIRLSRFSSSTGDRFGVPVGLDGHFHACLPRANYFLELPGDIEARLVVVTAPSPNSIVVRMTTRAAAETPAHELTGLTPVSITQFSQSLSNSVSLLGLGESNHGTREFSDERTSLAIELARTRGFHLVMIEAGYGETLALDDYLMGDSVDVDTTLTHIGYWIWDTKTFRASLDRLRAYNATVPSSSRVHIIGIDMQTTAGAIDFIQHNEHLTLVDVARLHQLATDDGAVWATLGTADRTAVHDLLVRLASNRTSEGAATTRNRVSLAAESILLRLESITVTDEWAKTAARDAAMARLVVDTLALDPASHATVWAHLAHVTRGFIPGQRSMGETLGIEFGSRYRAFALLAVRGSARAWDAARAVGVVVQNLRDPPDYSVEAVLGGKTSMPTTYWTFANATGDAANWLDGIHALRQFGSVFARDGHDFTFWDLRSIDGAIVFASITPSEPTPTGERRATPIP